MNSGWRLGNAPVLRSGRSHPRLIPRLIPRSGRLSDRNRAAAGSMASGNPSRRDELSGGCGIRLVEPEPVLHGRRTILRQLDGGEGPDGAQVHVVVAVGGAERMQRHDLLTGDAQGLAAGGEDVQ